tara:strand:+ start:1541 stop:3241 length:1701 start_codon:yes stop_codon:yes gene_type:complete
MVIFKQLFKITAQVLFVIIFIFFSTLEAKNSDKFIKGDEISDYFSGILLLNQNKYEESQKFLKKLDGLEKVHKSYSSKYIYSLINSGNFNQAFSFAKKLEKNKQDSFESDLIIGIYYLKNDKHDLSKKYFFSAKKRNSRSILDNYISSSLYNWSNLDKNNLGNAISDLNNLNERFQNLKKIQNAFLNCFFSTNKTEEVFEELISDEITDFSRYNYFYANYLSSIGDKAKAKEIVSNSLKKYPRNLLLNHYKTDLDKNENNFDFDCKNRDHISAEIIYITANALSSQFIYPLSNFYLNLAKYLNKEFHSFNTLMAENFYKIDDYAKAKKIYKELTRYGKDFEWYSNKQISRILIKEGKKEQSIKLLTKSYNDLSQKGIYETFDYAEFLKNNEEFKKSIDYYSKILNMIGKDHPLYPEVTDGRGVSYERIGEWDMAEKDLLESLKAKPNQAYVINYLAYSWIEQGIKIKKSLSMLEKANEIKSNDPYIIDSLGWALFKLKRYKESKKYLQMAVKLMPADPIVNDHYGDVLWKNGEEIQARYYWNYVLNLEKAEKDLKDKIEKKLITGL